MNETLIERLRDQLMSRNARAEEKRMFGGMCFMVRGNMSVGTTNKGEFMVRINPADQPAALKKKGARMMDFTGRPMQGFLFVSEQGYTNDKDLDYWVELAMRYNATLPEKIKAVTKATSTKTKKTVPKTVAVKKIVPKKGASKKSSVKKKMGK
jgi:TfoX/Sxy family transcriptional regulator of competence genes